MIAASMQNARHRRHSYILIAFAVIWWSACQRQQPVQQPDRPRLTPNVTFRDVTFRSAALNRDMQYRVILPVAAASGQRMPTVYLLHGGGGGFRDWSNYSDIARFAESGLVLVMPEGGQSYYANAIDPPQDRYEDYIVNDLVSDVESRFPVATGRANRSIIGVSMGGFGAVNLGLRHPERFVFVGGISSAIDVPRRSFSIRRLRQSLHYRSIFGSSGSQPRRDNDPFVRVRTVNPDVAPYFFLTCGEQEGLLPANREFAALLTRLHFKHEFHTVHGSHDWNQWNGWLPELFSSLAKYMKPQA